jgi:dolichol kinase
MKLSREEIRRKLLHLVALSMPIGIFYAPKWSFPPLVVPVILGALFSLSVIVETLRFRTPWLQKFVLTCFGSMMRQEERFKISGWTWVIGAAFFCSVLFSKYPHVSFMVLTLFITGDAMAALIGISMGRIKIGKKSLEGSLACFILCVILFYAVFPLIPGLFDNFPERGSARTAIIWTTAFVITFFELIPLKITRKLTINDNLAVPIIAGYVIIGLEKLLIR